MVEPSEEEAEEPEEVSCMVCKEGYGRAPGKLLGAYVYCKHVPARSCPDAAPPGSSPDHSVRLACFGHHQQLILANGTGSLDVAGLIPWIRQNMAACRSLARCCSKENLQQSVSCAHTHSYWQSRPRVCQWSEGMPGAANGPPGLAGMKLPSRQIQARAGFERNFPPKSNIHGLARFWSW